MSAKREVHTGDATNGTKKQFLRHAPRSQLFRPPKQVKTKKVIVMLPLFLWKLCNTYSQSTSCVTSIFEEFQIYMSVLNIACKISEFL